ncbi:MAG: helix-turn-helix transcriptional regulator, partial [Planctomycetota bacterium]|nr:helix-turn-helix transcriptional regulator [Planctomycetota bacterium]
LIGRLVEQHGSQRAVARAAGVDFKQVNTWAKGRARPTLDNLRRLRAALVDDEDQGDEPEEPEDDADESDDDDRPEPVRLVGALVDRFGDVEAAAEATGLGAAHLRRWSEGGPITPRALGRLREAANAPPGRNDARRREEATSAGADEAPAGEADAPPASRRTG